MLSALVLVAALTPLADPAAPMNLAHVRATYGPLGATRKSHELLPGDLVFLSFDIEGITVAPDGRVLYSVSTEVLDSQKKVVFKQESADLEAVNALGGNSLPAYTQLDVGLDSPPGTYTVHINVTDRASKRSAVLSQEFQVLKKGFGLVRLKTSADPEGRAPASILESGASLWVNCSVVGFNRNAEGASKVTVDLRILDEKGQPTLAKPFSGQLGFDVRILQALPVQFHLGLNRAGSFTIELKATDSLSGQTALLKFPLTVVARK